jgi:hypothetical protein
MPEPSPDALLERALEIALSEPEGWRRVVPTLAAENPEARVLDLVAAVARAALAVEETFASPERDGLPARLHRVAAMTALDAWCAGRQGWGEAKASQLDLFRRLHGRACEAG